MARFRVSNTGPLAPGPWLTYADLGVRWNKGAKTIQNRISSGQLPLTPVRLWPKADPVFSISEVEQHENECAAAAGVDLRNVK